MEVDIEHLPSNLFDNEKFQRQVTMIKEAAGQAQKETDYESAHNDHILLAITIIEKFLKKKHRICYGGQAINAYLPARYKFYDPEYTIPDYDFFTPDQANDIEWIENELRKAGFTEISAREGMHEGTTKIYVDFIPVADLTIMDSRLYRILSKRASRFEGISYLDANSLRMLMHLELSRPRGEVKRWEKVFERLTIFNEFVPIKRCQIMDSTLMRPCLSTKEVQFTFNYIIQEERVFAGGDLLSLYEHAFRSQKQQWTLSHRRPILFLSSDADKDVKKILTEFLLMRAEEGRKNALSIKTYSHKGLDLMPSIHVLHEGKQPLVIIVQQSACHSYYNLSMEDQKKMRIATMDTLITLYFGLGYVSSPYFTIGSMECLANQLVQLSIKARQQSDRFLFPFISVSCSGHQTTLPSLIRSKVERIRMKREMTKRQRNANALTRKNTKKNYKLPLI